MSNFSQKLKSLSSLAILLHVSLCITIGLLIWFIIIEANSVKEMRYIVDADFKAAISQRNLTEAAPLNDRLESEMNSHLLHKMTTSYYLIAGALFIIMLLSTAWFFGYKAIRHFKNIKSNERQLEELMYYDQVKEIHHRYITNKKLSPTLIKIQQNFELFNAELKHGLTENQFILYYQPIVSLEDGKIMDVEALIRWQHPEYGLLSPDVFLPLCETTGFIIPLGEWILKSACEQLKKWHDMGYTKLSIAVNLSTCQFNHPELLKLITHVLESSHIPPSCLILEITESVIMKDVEKNMKILNTLRHLGVQLALDDFGTGYSSFTYLKKFPFNVIKIDQSFIVDMPSNIVSIAIVESIITLAKSLGMTLIAEGVETKTQLYLLKKMKCDMFQGYLYSRSLHADKLTELLSKSDIISLSQTQNFLIDNTNLYQYQVMQQEHYDQAVDLISHTFSQYEPMTNYLGITYKEFKPFAKLMVEKAIEDGLSMVVLDGSNVCACSIVEDVAKPLNINIDIDPRFNIIFSFLEHLSGEFFYEKEIEKGHLAHLFITAVDKHYFGSGLSTKVNFESIKRAEVRKFDFMCCEFTHIYNEKGTVKHLKNGKFLIKSSYYKDFVFEGKRPFEHLEGFASAYIWELRDDAKLRYRIKSQEGMCELI